jgi:cobaltochelatase CobN
MEAVSLLLLSTADTDLLAARAVEEPALPLRLANPIRLDAVDLEGVQLVVVRLLGGRRAWEGLDALLADAGSRGVPVVAVGGEGVDAELTAVSTVPAGVVADAGAYLREGGSANLRELVAFLADTVLLTGHGFAPPQQLPAHGVRGQRASDPARPTVGVVYYRAHELSGNTAFVDVLCEAVEAAGANALPVFAGSLRPDATGALPVVDELLAGKVDALVVTVLASGGSNASDAEGWDAGALTGLDVPVLQGCASRRRGRSGLPPTPGSPRSTPPCRSRSRSSTGG